MYKETNMQTQDHLSGLGIMLVGLTSCSIGAYLTYSYSYLISTTLTIIALLCAGISIAMITADIRSR